jgi:hypothetical protein
MTSQSKDLAITIDDVSPDWITRALRSNGVEAEVDSITPLPIGTGQMCSCYRLALSYRRGTGPETLVVKLAADDPARRTADAFTYKCEVTFYRQIAPRVDVRIAQCYLAALSEDGAVFTLLLEDASPARAGDQIQGCTVQQARDAAVNIAGLHGPLWCDATLREMDWLIPMSPDIADLSAAFFKDSTEKFIDRYPLSGQAVDVFREFGDKSVAWWRVDPFPFTLLHGDYRLDNLLFGKPGTRDAVIAVDWQACMVGQPLRDVAFVAVSGLSIADRRAAERDIVGAYFDALNHYDIGDYSAEQCWQDYRLGVFHSAMITVFGAAAGKPTERGDRMFIAMAERSAAAISDLDALSVLG